MRSTRRLQMPRTDANILGNSIILYCILGLVQLVGTTMIRTSYLLNNEEQIELTNKITAAFTALR